MFDATPAEGKLKFNGSENHFVRAAGFRHLCGYAKNGGLDTANLQDSPFSKDTFVGTPLVATLSDGVSFYERAEGFEQVHAYATSGAGFADLASLYDSYGSDVFVAGPAEGKLKFDGSETHFARAAGFRVLYGYARSGGLDTAYLQDSPNSKDTFVATPLVATLSDGASFYQRAEGFERVNGMATPGTGHKDLALLYDGPGDDVFDAAPEKGTLKFNGSEDHFGRAEGFWNLQGFAKKGGVDTAYLHDSPVGRDVFVGTPTSAELYNGLSFHEGAYGFDQVHATATAGAGFADVARLFDSSENDVLEATPNEGKLKFSGSEAHFVRAADFRYLKSFALNGGLDTATLHHKLGSQDTFTGTPTEATLEGNGFFTGAWYYDEVTAYSAMGDGDTAYLDGSPDGYDILEADPQWAGYLSHAKMYGVGYSNRVVYFDRVFADAGAGTDDQAYLWDSILDDLLEVSGDSATLSRAGTPFLFEVASFDYVRAESRTSGDDDTVIEGGHSFELDLEGWWENL